MLRSPMTLPNAPLLRDKTRVGDSALAARLRREIEGEVLFDAFSRGRYSTDASIYQIEPIGVVIPRTPADIGRVIEIAREAGVPVLPRGAGTSQCGQTVGEALVVDTSKYLNRVVGLDVAARRVAVQPGIVLDQLNRRLEPHGLFFPVDVSPANRATIGGMAGNNSCGARSIRYGNMVHNVRAIEAVLADGSAHRFGEVPGNLEGLSGNGRYVEIVQRLRALHAREADEIERRFPKLLRRVGGYNIDSISPAGHNMSRMLVGSEGTLGFFTEIELELQPIPSHRLLGVCHFPTFQAAMAATRHIVELEPSAVEVVDRTLMDLARDIPMFRATIERCVRGAPEALLLTEFAEDNQVENLRRLKLLDDLMADLGHKNSVVEAIGSEFQKAVWEVRKSGLNIMMSMKSDGKPVSFIEDCSVPLEHLADYTERLTEVFEKHGTRGTWYAHASVGCLHVRPVLNLKLEKDAQTMRAIAEEAFEMVSEYKGAHSGEHGDGLVRSEFHRPMYGDDVVEMFETVKDRFDPDGRMNPGKIVRPPRMNNRELFRYKPDYKVAEIETALDWSGYAGAGGGFQGAIEMCNNNGACRKFDAGVMCPSYRVTRNERDVTRGRANTLRLAISGQLGRKALTSPAMRETMKYCVSCKACRRECPTGVDMAKMKIEVQHAVAKREGVTLHDRLIAYMPRYAPWAGRVPWLANMRDRIPGLARLSERWAGFAAKRPLPRWRGDAFRASGPFGPEDGAPVALFVDTFNRAFAPDTVRAAIRVLTAAGYRVTIASAGRRPLCCGRTYLSVGLVEEARREADRLVTALAPFVEAETPILGLEPSCLFALHDEVPSLLPGPRTDGLGEHAMLFEQFLAREHAAGRLALPLKALNRPILLHGHCHQKAFAALDAVETALKLIPGARVETISSSCCGMAGAFGYGADTYDMSMAMGELSLLPAVRQADTDAVLVADGFSCRHQIRDGTGRTARHAADVLNDALSERYIERAR